MECCVVGKCMRHRPLVAINARTKHALMRSSILPTARFIDSTTTFEYEALSMVKKADLTLFGGDE